LSGSAGEPSAAQEAALEVLVRRRLEGEPIQHLLSSWSFRSLELCVDRRALIPRPETEIVVEHALDALALMRHVSSRALVAVDLGTGSGAIACSLVEENPDVHVVGVDISREALSLAAENRDRLRAEAAVRLELREGSWYEPLKDLRRRVAVVVSNPPYVATREWDGLDPIVREFDPYGALVAGPSGLEAIEAVLSGAPALLVPGGLVVVEIAPHQADAARAFALGHGATAATVHLDLAGRPRCLVARW
jgi:release factor glutamine methyltransferase